MPEPAMRTYGLWDSPVSPRRLAEDRRVESPRFDTAGPGLVWLEGRSGHGMLVADDGSGNAPRDLTAESSVRAEVGYGGGDYTLHAGHAWFAVHKTGRLFRQPLAGGAARAVTPPFGQAASPVVSPDGRWLAYVHHCGDEDRLAVVDAAGESWPQVLAAGRDFYMQPRFSPDGRKLAFIAWDHPNMPWDGASLCVADVLEVGGTLRLGPIETLAGGAEVSVFQPEFSPDGGALCYVSDETGWGRLVWHDLTTGVRRWLTPDGQEYATPAWAQDQRTYAISADGRWITAALSDRGLNRLVRIETATARTSAVEAFSIYTDISQVAASSAGDRVAFVASAPAIPPRVIEHDFSTGRTRIVARSSGETILSGLAECESVSWETGAGETAHGLFYAPASDRFASQGRPPLVVSVHGGPTSQAKAGWRAEAQFLATRGYAVLVVNYRGSTGFGRPYMLRLRGNWGVCDVEDCLSGVQFLSQQGRIDPRRTAIMGGSAGGFTVLQTMCEHPEAFQAGISLFGVADQFHLAAQTHKFESRYLDTMLGPLPEAAEIYRQRSPVMHAQKIRRPLAVFQGDIDQVVPRAQSDVIVEALRRSGTPHIYHVYQGEGHGWRKRETIEHYYQAVEDFLRQYVVFA